MPADVSVIIPAFTAIAGVSAAIFTALRFNRDDASAVVNQQKEVLGSMKSLNDELQEALDRCRGERDEERGRRIELERESAALEVRVAAYRRELRLGADDA